MSLASKRVMVIYGTRPEAVKVAPIVHALAENPDTEPVLISTGQQKDLLAPLNAVLGLNPDRDLEAGDPDATLNWRAGKILQGIDQACEDFKPDMILVQGDTTTAFMGAFAAFNRQIPVAHLEAGLRSHDLFSPFPEEGNRRLVACLTALHLAPTQTAKQNLLDEGVDHESIVISGNTVVDALQRVLKEPQQWENGDVPRILQGGRRIVTVTAHRRENLGLPLENISTALGKLAERYSDVDFVFPLHPNPQISAIVRPAVERYPNVHLVAPLEYSEFTQLLRKSVLVLSDSGGVQEEAPILGVPLLILRENTERPEAVISGAAKLVGHDIERILTESALYLDTPAPAMPTVSPFGDGYAAERCVAAICHYFGLGERSSDFIPKQLTKSSMEKQLS